MIDSEVYQISESMKRLFTGKNEAALKDAHIEVEVNGNSIQKITQIELKNRNGSELDKIVLDGENTVIDGSIVLAADYYQINNLTIKGDFTITSDVKNSFEADNLHIKGTTHINEDIQPLTNRSMYSVVSVENPMTRITIVFKDSTTAVIEIAKKDLNFSATGSTKITELILNANASIFTNENVIIPKVSIRNGVTHVELNATIADVIIDSNTEVTVSGSGNFENVVVNTDKNINIDTTGTIQNLDTRNEKSKVSIGKEVKVETVLVPENTNVQDIITNYDEIKDQIGEITDKVEYFSAGILHIDNRFGYIKLNIKNQGKHEVKYQLVKRHTGYTPAKVGDTVPSDAKEYIKDDEFILWHMYDLYVYQVDASGAVVDVVNTNTVWHYPLEWVVTPDNFLQVTTTIDVGERTVADVMQAAYLYNGKQVEKITDFANAEWNTKDGLKGFNLKLDKAVNQEEPLLLLFHTNEFSTESYGNHSSMSDDFSIYVVHDLAKDTNPTISWHFGHLLDRLTEEYYEKEVSTGGTHLERKSIVEMDSVSIAAYKEELIKNTDNLLTKESIAQMVKEVNVKLEITIEPYKNARTLVENLFKEDYHLLADKDRLRDGVTQNDIDAAEAAVSSMESIFTERAYLMDRVNYAKYLLK